MGSHGGAVDGEVVVGIPRRVYDAEKLGRRI
jgi:hypothetical protein